MSQKSGKALISSVDVATNVSGTTEYTIKAIGDCNSYLHDAITGSELTVDANSQLAIVGNTTDLSTTGHTTNAIGSSGCRISGNTVVDNIWAESRRGSVGTLSAADAIAAVQTMVCPSAAKNTIGSATEVTVFDVTLENQNQKHCLMIYFPPGTLHRDSMVSMVALKNDIALFPFVTGKASRFNFVDHSSHNQSWSSWNLSEALEVGTVEKFRSKEEQGDGIEYVATLPEDLCNAVIITHEMKLATRPPTSLTDSIADATTLIGNSGYGLGDVSVTTLGHPMVDYTNPYKK